MVAAQFRTQIKSRGSQSMQTAPAGTAGASGFIALENGLSSVGNSGAIMIGSGLAPIDRRGGQCMYVTVGSGDSGQESPSSHGVVVA